MNEWVEFFEHEAPQYEQEVFTKNTAAELDFLAETLQLAPGASILDVGCGTGRHSLGLAKRGFQVTGVDISPDMLAVAEATRQESGLQARFICHNAREFVAEQPQDAAICLCEGALCLLGSADDPIEADIRLLRNVHASLKPGTPFILTALNASRHIRMYSDQDVAEGRFDYLNLVELNHIQIQTPQGPSEIVVRERAYTPTELRRMLMQAGFSVEHIYGGTAGAWNRQTPSLDEIELMAIARKPA
jgi:2-polyprenyl-3-methyl-5-hydroxy-6-metoxy-1,4-benzoquinol methylase